MERSRGGRAVLLALLLTLAGCVGAPTAATDPEPTASATTDREAPATPDAVAVRGGSLPANATLVFERVEELHGVDVEAPTVHVERITERGSFADGSTPIRRLFGVAETEVNLSRAGGLTRTDGTVFVHPGASEPRRIERVLAHEFVHVVQFRSGTVPWPSADASTDRRLARLGVVEGAAVDATDAYVARYRPNATRQSAQVARDYERGPSGNRLLWARYLFGHRYVDGRVDAPAELDRVYATPPNTTEQLVHGLDPGAEPPRPLSADVTVTREGWRRAVADDTAGELFVRVVLRSRLGRERAARAAAGWGNDSLHAFGDGRRVGAAWVLRWDSATDADEFAAAFRRYADRRGPRFAFGLRRPTPNTTVAVAGPAGFVENATATATADGVRVRVR